MFARTRYVGGIDFAGVVESSDDSRFAAGDRVVLTGWRVGETHWGGYAERARVSGDWLVRLPNGLSTLRCDDHRHGRVHLDAGGRKRWRTHGIGSGPVLVTGAAGGVGSVAVHLLSAAGHEVAASTGRPQTADYLRNLGASEIIDRAELSEPPQRPLGSERFGGCVDAVGGTTLANVLTQMSYGSSVAACGLAGGNGLDTTVIPFLLRGVNLLGIDSVMCPYEPRAAAWQRLDQLVDRDLLASMATTVGLGKLADLGPKILAGEVQGRTVVDVRA